MNPDQATNYCLHAAVVFASRVRVGQLKASAVSELMDAAAEFAADDQNARRDAYEAGMDKYSHVKEAPDVET